MLEVQGLSVELGGRWIFKSVQAQFREAEISFLLGPSGCGKSTLLRCLAGLQAPQAGKISWTPPLSSPRIGMVFQEANLLPWLTTLENVLLPMELSRKNPDIEKARTLLKDLGILHAETLRPSQLSGGMKMRAAVARALLGDPELLLLDEPFAALDEPTREDLQIWTREYVRNRSHCIAVMVTHSLNEALFMGDRIYSMGPGRGILSDIPIQGPSFRDRDYLNSELFLNLKREKALEIRK